MNNLKNLITLVALITIIISCELKMPKQKEINKTFLVKDTVKIETIGGDCIVKSGNQDSINLKIIHSYNPIESFQPEFIETGNKLSMKEILNGNSSGKSTWTLLVPNNKNINISSGSGVIQIENIKSRLSVNTISGKINVSKSEGLFLLESVSALIEGIDLKGGFSVKNISGDLNFKDIWVQSKSNWSNISGNNKIMLKKGSEGDISIGSISGKSLLNNNGNSIMGSFEFIAEVDEGEIICPIQFTDESEFTREEKRYYRKSFQKITDSPKIIISTISGSAELREE